ncbi:hypothetical protein [Celeribacter sp. ULVN23_4]
MKKALYTLLSLGIALCLAPIPALIWVSWFAERHGCRVDEAGVYPCIVNGHDWGGTLAGLGMTGWLLLLTLPLAALLALALVILIVVDLIRRPRRR